MADTLTLKEVELDYEAEEPAEESAVTPREDDTPTPGPGEEREGEADGELPESPVASNLQVLAWFSPPS